MKTRQRGMKASQRTGAWGSRAAFAASKSALTVSITLLLSSTTSLRLSSRSAAPRAESFTITNLGPFATDFEYALDPAPFWASPSVSASSSLESGQSEPVVLTLAPPLDAPQGTTAFLLTARSLRDGGTRSVARIAVNALCAADLTGDGVLDLADVNAFIAAFIAQDPAADLAPPFGVFDRFDLAAFVTAFVHGCR